jgi:hypothetical protein
MNLRLIWLAFATAVIASSATKADFGLIGIKAFENARLTAFCDGSVAPNPCAITLEFHDIGGNTLKQSTLTLQPGTGGFLDFTASASGFGGPVLINPCFDVLRGAAFASLEVFDVFTLRTRILINWGDRSLAKTGDVDFGLAGITRSDTARLGAFCEADGSVAPPPCDITFEFHDIQGNAIKQSRMTLQPDTGGFLDLKWSETGTTARRVELSPCFKVAVGGGPAVGTLAVVDNFSGLTLAQAYPATLAVAVQ